MIRRETYCDCCGAQMSVTDMGNTDVFGISLAGVVEASANVKTMSGSSSFMSKMHGKDFCSAECFRKELDKFTERLFELVKPKEV